MRELQVPTWYNTNSHCYYCNDVIYYDDGSDLWISDSEYCQRSFDGRHWER